jgi:hypothetical protein
VANDIRKYRWQIMGCLEGTYQTGIAWVAFSEQQTIHSERSIVSRVERFRHAENISVCWNRPDPIVLNGAGAGRHGARDP